MPTPPSQSTPRPRTANESIALNKACESCRASKTKCQPNTNSNNSNDAERCLRCAMTGRVCVFAPVTQRRPRRRIADTRIAELERQLREMKSVVAHRDSSVSSASTTPVFLEAGEDDDAVTPERKTKNDALEQGILSTYPPDGGVSEETPLSLSPSILSEGDVIDRGILSLETAEELLAYYMTHHAQQYPITIFPAGTTVATLRRTKPTLLLSILAAASGSSVNIGASGSGLFRDLNVELLRRFAHLFFLTGAKTVELAQSMLVMVVWYFPPDRFEDLKHYQYVNMAASIAMDLRLDSAESEHFSEDLESEEASTGPDKGLENCRVILMCYLLSAGLATTADKPNMLRFTPFMNTCTHLLRTSPSACLADKRLLAMVELLRLSEEVKSTFRAGTIAPRPLIWEQIKALAHKMDTWEKTLDHGVMNEALEVHFHYSKARLFEAALYEDHRVDDFWPPFIIRSTAASGAVKPPLTPPYTRTIFALVNCLQAILDSFLSIEREKALSGPSINYIRALYALSVLAELHMSSTRPGNELAKIIDAEFLSVHDYMLRMEAFVATLAGTERFRVPEKFVFVIQRLIEWWEKASNPITAAQLTKQEQVYRPLANLRSTPPSQRASVLSRKETQLASPLQARTPMAYPNAAISSPQSVVPIGWDSFQDWGLMLPSLIDNSTSIQSNSLSQEHSQEISYGHPTNTYALPEVQCAGSYYTDDSVDWTQPVVQPHQPSKPELVDMEDGLTTFVRSLDKDEIFLEAKSPPLVGYDK